MKLLKKIKENEQMISEIDSGNLFPKPTITKKNTAKFSMSNENEFLFNSRNSCRSYTEKSIFSSAHKLPVISVKKIYECKAKSEEKYTGNPAYQIFMARNPEIQVLTHRFTSAMEKKIKLINCLQNPESASLRKFKKESLDNFEEIREKSKIIKDFQIHEEIKSNKQKSESELLENPSIITISYWNLIKFYGQILALNYNQFSLPRQRICLW